MNLEANASDGKRRAKAYPFSVLVRQHLVLKAKFGPRYPHAWLVWEAGPWLPVAENDGVAKTRLPGVTEPRPTRTDPMCFDLIIDPGQRVQVGRAPTNDVVLEDATISRSHFFIERRASDVWSAIPAPGASATVVIGSPLLPEGMTLTPGLILYPGDLLLTFHSAASFENLVAGAASRLA